MKMKTDFYTKAILTVIAIALVGNFLKDVDFVSKANAKSTNLADLKSQQEQQTTAEQSDITFYVYDNDLLKSGFGQGDKASWEAYISYNDIPKYIITTKTGFFELDRLYD